MARQRPDMDQNVKQIVESRADISHKLALLKQRLHETIHDSQASADHLITHVRHTAAVLMDHTKQELNPLPYLRARPWGMMSGAIVVGFVIGRVASHIASRQGVATDVPRISPNVAKPASAARGRWAQSTVWRQVKETIRAEIEQVKEAATEHGHHLIDDLLHAVRPGMQDPAMGRGRSRPSRTSEVSRDIEHPTYTEHTLQDIR